MDIQKGILKNNKLEAKLPEAQADEKVKENKDMEIDAKPDPCEKKDVKVSFESSSEGYTEKQNMPEMIGQEKKDTLGGQASENLGKTTQQLDDSFFRKVVYMSNVRGYKNVDANYVYSVPCFNTVEKKGLKIQKDEKENKEININWETINREKIRYTSGYRTIEEDPQSLQAIDKMNLAGYMEPKMLNPTESRELSGYEAYKNMAGGEFPEYYNVPESMPWSSVGNIQYNII